MWLRPAAQPGGRRRLRGLQASLLLVRSGATDTRHSLTCGVGSFIKHALETTSAFVDKGKAQEAVSFLN